MAIGNIDSLSASLAKMTPQQRQQYAQMHKDDPIIVSLAKFINDSEQQKAQALRGAQMGQQPPAPKVVDQAISGMAQQLPENVGIGALPQPGMQAMADGGIVGYADGGDVQGYAKGGTASIDEVLDMEGVEDPTERAFLKSLYAQESGSGKNTKTSNRGARGPMQVMPGTFKDVASPGMDIDNPVDNLRAGVRYGRQGFQAAGGDPALAGAFYYGGPGGLAKAKKGIAVSDPQNPTYPNTLQYGQSVAKRMTDMLPISSAQAAPQSGPATSSAADQIPGQSFKAPAKIEEERSIFGRAADAMGISPNVQRNVSNTMNAVAPLAMPATGAVNAAQIYTRGLGSPGIIGNTMRASALTPALASPATPEKALSAYEQASAEATPPKEDAADAFRKSERDYRASADIPKEVKKEAVDLAKATVPKKDSKGFTGEDWLTLGLGLLSNKSSNFSQALGESGLGAMKGRKERLKDERDAESDAVKDRLYEAQAKYYEANAAATTDGSKMLPQALKAGNDAYDDWFKGLSPIEQMNLKPEQVEAKRREFLQSAMAQFKIAGSPADTGGFKMLGSRPA